MLTVPEIFSLLLLAIIIVIAVFLYKKRQYQQAINQPFPQEYQTILNKRLPIYEKLPEPLRIKLHQHILCFIYTKIFIGCNDLTITDEMRVTIAAEACLLILNRPSSCYAALKWIYVYPSVFVAKQAQRNEYGIVSTKKRHLLGESWQNGKVILAWDSVESGMANFSDGQNVVLHEFAHQLDQENGSANGAPLLYTKDSYRIWSKVFSDEFSALQHSLATGHCSLIDSYGATNPAEFFAVVTEVFFERASSLKKLHPELFQLLKDYYQLDPRIWQK